MISKLSRIGVGAWVSGFEDRADLRAAVALRGAAVLIAEDLALGMKQPTL